MKQIQTSYNPFLQEAGPWVHEIFFHKFLLGFLSVVLFRRRSMWILSVSNIWIESLAKLVRSLYILHTPSMYYLL